MGIPWPNGSPAIPRVTSEFNPARKHPKTGKVQPHRGIDLAGWSTIVSPVAGRVTTKAYQAAGAGHYVNVTESGTGDVFKFFHLASASHLHVGAVVRPGDSLGVMGRTGSATGVHLHFEVHPRGAGAVNPRTYYATRNQGDDMPTPREIAAEVWLIKHNELEGGNARDWLRLIPMKTWLVRHAALGNRTGHEALATIEGKVDGVIAAVKELDGVDPETIERVVAGSIADALKKAGAAIADKP